LLDDLLLDMGGPEHLRDIDGEEEVRDEDHLDCGGREVLDQLPDSDTNREVVRLPRDQDRELSTEGLAGRLRPRSTTTKR
jgi:hypothetical protein